MILCLIELFKRVKNGYLIWRELFNQTSLSGAGSLAKEAIKEKEIGRGTNKSIIYQHDIKTLSNFHSPTIVQGGMKRRNKDLVSIDRDTEQSEVDCNAQQIDYCYTSHLIGKGNGAEAKYDLSTKVICSLLQCQ